MTTRILITAITCCALLSCSTARNTKILKNWIGHTKNDLIWVWGPPVRTDSDGAGGEVLQYEERNAGSDNSWNIYRITYFYVGHDGEIYHTLVKNSKKPSQPDKRRIINSAAISSRAAIKGQH
jgi:hypothetical protein